MTLSPSLTTPVSTRPTGTVPTPVIVYTSCIGTRRGLSNGFGGGMKSLSASNTVTPLYQGVLVLFFDRLSPSQPLVGTNGTFETSKPTVLSNPSSSFRHSLYRSSEYLTVWSSILLMATTRFFTPRVLARYACSLACPPGPTATSNSPFLPETTRIATSAWLAPVIMFLMKSRCPGASMMVKKFFVVSNFWNDKSIVTPLSRSSLMVSRTHANLNVSPAPVFSDSFAY